MSSSWFTMSKAFEQSMKHAYSSFPISRYFSVITFKQKIASRVPLFFLNMLLVHKYGKLLVYPLTMNTSLHSKFFKNFDIKVKTLYTSKNSLRYLISQLCCQYFELFWRQVISCCWCEYRAQLNQPAFSLTGCFYFLYSFGPSTGMYSFMRTFIKRNKGIIKLL